MTACPIFQTFEAVKRVSVELDQLLGDIIARLRNAEPDLFKDAADYKWDDCLPEEDLSWVELGGALTIPVAVKDKGTRGKPKARHLSIRFDLYREVADDEPPIWEHASEAFIVIGYSPFKDNPWYNEIMVVTRDGRLRDQETWEACRNNRHADGRLLEYAETAGNNWSQRGWIFALPLRSFKDPESVDKQFVKPVLRLLAKNEAPDVSLAGTDAIEWSQQPTSASPLTGHSK